MVVHKTQGKVFKFPKHKMENKIILIFGILFLLGSVSALELNLTAGETYPIELGETYYYYFIVGNTTIINLSVEQIGTIVNITLNKYSTSDNFEIIFFNKEKEIINHYSGGGGGSRKIYVENKTYVEVPNYITVYQNNDTNQEKNDDLEEYEKNFKYIFWMGVIIILCLIGIIIKVYNYHKKRKKRKDGTEKN